MNKRYFVEVRISLQMIHMQEKSWSHQIFHSQLIIKVALVRMLRI